MTFRQMGLSALAASAYCTSNMFALPIQEVEGNDSVATAQNINAFFSTEFSPDIGDSQPGVNTSTTIPHVSIAGSRSITDSDFFKFAVNGIGSTGIFDIDYATNHGHDTQLQLYTAAGVLLAENDIYDPHTVGAAGSVSGRDPFIQYSFALPGEYIIGVSSLGYSGSYVLQVSISNPTVAAGVPDTGATISLMGIGMLGVAVFGACSRRRSESSTSRAFSPM